MQGGRPQPRQVIVEQIAEALDREARRRQGAHHFRVERYSAWRGNTVVTRALLTFLAEVRILSLPPQERDARPESVARPRPALSTSTRKTIR